MVKPSQLPYDPEVDTWGQRKLQGYYGKLTYEEAYQIEEYVNLALGIKTTVNRRQKTLRKKPTISLPIEFSQFVLRKRARQGKEWFSFYKAIQSKAKDYFNSLIGKKNFTQETMVHPANDTEEASHFRNIFTKVFCKKVLMNLQTVQDDYFDHFARVFPFVVRRDVPDYKINVLNCFDDDFYQTMQIFLDQHFDNVQARQVIRLFLNNIRHFLEEPPSDYIDTLPVLGGRQFQKRLRLHKEYRVIQEHFENFNLARLYDNNEDLKNLPEKNIEEVTSLLQTMQFRTEYETYTSIFKKYLFFFLHAIDENPNLVYFIDDIIFHCLLNLKKYKTGGKAVSSVNEIVAITLLEYLNLNNGKERRNKRRYEISSSALIEIENYLTKLASGKRVQFNVKFDQTKKPEELMPVIIGDTYFTAMYGEINLATFQQQDQFLKRLVLIAESPDDNPIKCIIAYDAHTGKELKFRIPDDVRASVKNFIRLSVKPEANRKKLYSKKSEKK